LYTLGCFSEGSIDDIFSQDVITFPLDESKMDIPIFLACDGEEPSSADRMSKHFKQHAKDAGLPGHVSSYSMRSGFVRDLFSREIPDETVKKLLHHTPRSTDARRHYEGDLTNLDIAALRTGLPPRAPSEMDKLSKGYMLMYVDCSYPLFLMLFSVYNDNIETNLSN
jgi:hypothetical protein